MVAEGRWRRSTVCGQFQRALAGGEVAASVAAPCSGEALHANFRQRGRCEPFVEDVAEAIDCRSWRAAPQRVAMDGREVLLYTRQARRASQLWSKEMTP
jgi:hypothetical protein